MNLEVTPLTQGSARLVRNQGHADILQLSTDAVWELFQGSGLLLFRGFGVTDRHMRQFSERFSTDDEVISPGRALKDTGAGTVQYVEPGQADISLHRENGFMPIQPDLLWFCCARPASDGGQTTFCDGVELWRALRESTRRLFTGHKVVSHDRGMPLSHFRKLFDTELSTQEVSDILAAIYGGLEGLNARIAGLGAEGSHTVSPDGTFHVQFRCSAVIQTRFGRLPAFANQIPVFLRRTANKGYAEHSTDVTLDDGSPLPPDVVEELFEAARPLTHEIQWEPGDLVLIDNSRYMHGRRAFADAGRTVYSLGTYANR